MFLMGLWYTLQGSFIIYFTQSPSLNIQTVNDIVMNICVSKSCHNSLDSFSTIKLQYRTAGWAFREEQRKAEQSEVTAASQTVSPRSSPRDSGAAVMLIVQLSGSPQHICAGSWQPYCSRCRRWRRGEQAGDFLQPVLLKLWCLNINNIYITEEASRCGLGPFICTLSSWRSLKFKV